MIAQLMAEIRQMLSCQPSFEKRSRVYARRRVALKVNTIARLLAVTGVEKVIEPDFKKRGDGCVRGDVPADAVIELVLPRHHSHGIPTREGLDAALERAVPWIWHFLFRWNGVDVRRVVLDGQLHAHVARPLRQALQKKGGAVGSGLFHYLIHRLQPL